MSSTSSTSTTTPASVGAQLITSLGLGTGINMTNLATQIAGASYGTQLTNLSNQLAAVKVQISDASTLQSNVASLVSAFGTMVNGGQLASTPTVTNSTVATASLPAGASGGGTGYSLEVDQLASAQVLTSPALASASATTGSGTLTFTFGKIANGGFTADSSKSAVNVTVNKGDSLSQIAQDINGAGAGLTAYVANTSAGAKLVIEGPTGADSAFTVSASEASGDPGLSTLAWSPSSTSTTSTVAQSAADAQYKLNGIAETSASNTIANAAPNLSLTLTGTNAGNPTTITYSNPASGITNGMQSFVTALNALVSTLNTDMTYSATTGNLASDPGAQALQRQLARLPGTTIMPNAAAGAPSTLADLGLSVNKDGVFNLDTTVLANALTNNPAGVAAMFTNGLNGIYGTLSNLSEAISSTTDPGSLAGSVTYYTNQQTALTTQKTQVESEQTNLTNQLIAQFATANTSVANSKSTLSYLQQQIAAWQGNSNTPGL